MRVHGLGPQDATLMFVGEGPGAVESDTGIPFHPDAPAGAELTRYCNGFSIPVRDDIYITNLVKEWEGGAATKHKGKKQDVTQADVDREQWELAIELETVRPRFIATLGRWSTRWFLGDVDMDAVHGLLFRVGYCLGCGRRFSDIEGTMEPGAWDMDFPVGHLGVDGLECGAVLPFWLVPIYHPAAGLHQPELAARTAYGFAQLAHYLSLGNAALEKRAWRHAPHGWYETVESLCIMGPTDIGIDTEYDETTGTPYCFSTAAAPGGYGHMIKAGGVLEVHPQSRFVLHFYGADAPMLAKMGITIPEDRFDDTAVMAYLLGVEPQGLKDLALRHLGRVRKTFLETFGEYQTVIGKSGKPLKKKKLVIKKFDEVNPTVVRDYAGADPDDTVQLKPILWNRIRDLHLEQVYEIDRRVLPLYSRMEQAGLPVDVEHFEKLKKDLADDLEVRTMCLQADWPDFNPGNPDHVAHILFDILKLPAHKKTPTGKRFSTQDKILEGLTHLHPIVQELIDWREVQKIKGTFADKILTFCRQAPDGSGLRMYYELLVTRVVSGRLAAKNPNVLAFPKYTKLGKLIRSGFRAAKGRKLGSFDLSQIELRVIALDSGSQTLAEIFRKGLDQHGITGARIFGGSPEDYKSGKNPKRVAAKAVNFSIPMGTTKYGLAEQMRKNKYPFPELAGKHFHTRKARLEAEAEVCDAWIKEIISFWGIEGYISDAHAQARAYGYVEDRWGRKRFLPSVLSTNKQVREAAQREAQAFRPQAGARGFMKTIEWRVWREFIQPLQADGYYIEPLLDIHDDLTCEFQEDLSDTWMSVVGSIFNGTFTDLPIPIVAEGSVADRWSDL